MQLINALRAHVREMDSEQPLTTPMTFGEILGFRTSFLPGGQRKLIRWRRFVAIEPGSYAHASVKRRSSVEKATIYAALVITTNLPFSEWTQVFTNARLCKALLDRITDRATIIETGSESFRFRRTLVAKRKSPASVARS
jgi:methionine-rich copper-binding protein CopC